MLDMVRQEERRRSFRVAKMEMCNTYVRSNRSEAYSWEERPASNWSEEFRSEYRLEGM